MMGILLEIGAGSSRRPGFIHTDICPPKDGDHHLEYICSAQDLYPFKDSSVEYIYMHGVWEHFYYVEAVKALQEFKRVLEPGGIIELTTPDLKAICKLFLENKIPDEWIGTGRSPLKFIHCCLYGNELEDNPMKHRWAWTLESLHECLRENGFQIFATSDMAFERGTHLHVKARKL